MMLDVSSIDRHRILFLIFCLASAELIHWKQRMATFNNLLEQIKSPRCRAVVGVLQSAKSKSINRWKDLV